MDFFNSTEHLEAKCPKCGTKIELDITTEWCDKAETHVCKECRTKVDSFSVF